MKIFFKIFILPLKWLKNSIILITLLFILLYIFSGFIYQYKDTLQTSQLPSDIDAIICLAGGRGRIITAGDLWLHYWKESQKNTNVFQSVPKLPLLYFAGMGAQTHWNLIFKQLSTSLQDILEPKHIYIENKSINTNENAYWAVQIAKQKNWKKIILLTSSYHMKRAKFIFQHTFKIQNYPIQMETWSVYQEPFTPHNWKRDFNGIRVTFNEYVKGLYYRLLYH